MIIVMGISKMATKLAFLPLFVRLSTLYMKGGPSNYVRVWDHSEWYGDKEHTLGDNLVVSKPHDHCHGYIQNGAQVTVLTTFCTYQYLIYERGSYQLPKSSGP